MRAIAISFLVIGLWGCRAPKGLLLSLEDVSSEVSVSRGDGQSHLRMASLGAALPGFDAGVPYHYERSSRRKQFPPQTGFGLTTGNSHVVGTVYRSSVSRSELMKIRDALLTVRLKAVDAVVAKLAVARARQGTNAQALATAERDYQAKRAEYSRARIAATKAINHANVLVFQYASQNQRSGSAAFGKGARAGFTRSEKQSGFAIVSGLRIARLFVGPDMPKSDILRKLRDSDDTEHIRLTTFVMQAKELLYVAESELGLEFQAKLSATIEQLRDVRGGLLGSDKIEIDLLIAGAVSASNGGSLEKGVSRALPVYWAQSRDSKTSGQAGGAYYGVRKNAAPAQGNQLIKQASLRDLGNSSAETWTTFYQVDTELSKVLVFVK